MLDIKIVGALIILRSFFCGCGTEPKTSGFEKNKREYTIKPVARLPKGFLETSGLAISNDPRVYYTHTDSGGKNHLYKITKKGQVLDTLVVEGAKNQDWEDLATDDQGNIYIGDFGNNLNKRKDLKIYKYSPQTKKLDVISFSFKDQVEFPPPKENRNFDIEGFFWNDGFLHMFSKNRGDKLMKYYKLPDSPGNYEAEPLQEFFLNGMITAADISHDKSIFALLSYGKIYLFKIDEKGNILDSPYKCLPFKKGAQSEGLVFINNTDFLISNETGRLFIARKKDKKRN